MNVVSARKATVDCCTALTLMPSLLFLNVRIRIFEVVTKLAQLHKRTYVSGFRHFLHESAWNSCLDSSTRHRAENPHGVVWKIRACPLRYPCPPAPEIRGIFRKNVSYPCQFSYVHGRETSTVTWCTNSDNSSMGIHSFGLTSSCLRVVFGWKET